MTNDRPATAAPAEDRPAPARPAHAGPAHAGPTGTRARLSRAAIVALVFAATLTVGLASCGHSSTGLGRLTVNGQVQVTGLRGAAHSAHSGDVLHAGDRVQVVSGQALLRLSAGGVLDLRPGSQVVVDRTPRLAAGVALIQPMGHSLQVAAEAATLVVPSGVAQLAVDTAGTSLTAKVYQATSHLDIAGNPPAPIRAPRQVTLTPETRLPVQAIPLQYQDTNPWDHLYLSGAATISTQLGVAATGFNAQVPANQGKDAAFYQQLLPVLNGRADFVQAFDVVQRQQPIGTAPAAKPGDYLIASVIALRGTNGTFGDRLNSEMAFYAQGAPWGFVAYDQGVMDLSGVLNDVLAGIGRAALPFTGAPASQIAIGPPPATPGTPTPPTTRPSRQPAPTTTTTTPANPRPRHPPATTTTTTPPLIQLPVPVLPGPLGSLLNPLLDPLIQALNNILAGRH